jgi:ferrous-iron efflux pump FieF
MLFSIVVTLALVSFQRYVIKRSDSTAIKADALHYKTDLLMDHELPDEERQKIRNLIINHPQAIGFHDLRTRRSGNTVFVQLHLELDETLSLRAAHAIADQLEHEVAALFDEAEVIIHEDHTQLPLNS